MLAAAILLPAVIAFGFSWDTVDLDKVTSGGTKLYKATAGLTDGEEITLGREVAANLAARYGLVEDPVKVEYLNLIAKTLAPHTARPTIPYKVGILRSSEINAFAAPGGYIFATDGLLATLQDESELAGVIAHEMSHVAHKHIVKAIRKANLVGAGQDLAQAGGVDVNAYAPLSDFSIKLLTKGLSRTDELDADKAGTELAAAAGYDVAGLHRSIERLAKEEKGNMLLARFQKTHPSTKDRLAAIDKVLPKYKNEKGAKLPDRFHSRLFSK
jgi:beta-barrel assembly-enhancing protease